MEPRSYRVIRKLPSGGEGVLGVATRRADGWWFISHTQTRNSRKGWPTPQACIPRGATYDELRPVEPKQ